MDDIVIHKETGSAAEAATNCRRDVRIKIGPFNLISCLSWGSHPKKKCPVSSVFCFRFSKVQNIRWM